MFASMLSELRDLRAEAACELSLCEKDKREVASWDSYSNLTQRGSALNQQLATLQAGPLSIREDEPSESAMGESLSMLKAERKAIQDLIDQNKLQIEQWFGSESDSNELYEFRSLQDRRRRHMESHLEGYETQLDELDRKILRIEDPEKASAEEAVHEQQRSQVFALTLGATESPVKDNCFYVPVAGLDKDARWCMAVANLANKEEIPIAEQIEETTASIQLHCSLIEEYSEWEEILSTKVDRLHERIQAMGEDADSDEIDEMRTMKDEMDSVREKRQGAEKALKEAKVSLEDLHAEAGVSSA